MLSTDRRAYRHTFVYFLSSDLLQKLRTSECCNANMAFFFATVTSKVLGQGSVCNSRVLEEVLL